MFKANFQSVHFSLRYCPRELPSILTTCGSRETVRPSSVSAYWFTTLCQFHHRWCGSRVIHGAPLDSSQLLSKPVFFTDRFRYCNLRIRTNFSRGGVNISAGCSLLELAESARVLLVTVFGPIGIWFELNKSRCESLVALLSDNTSPILRCSTKLSTECCCRVSHGACASCMVCVLVDSTIVLAASVSMVGHEAGVA